MALLILALLQRIFLMSSLMLLLVWLIFFMVLIKLLPILGTISGKTVKLMVLALITIMATIQRINIIGSREGSRNRRRLKANQTGKKFRVGIKSNISTNRNNLISGVDRCIHLNAMKKTTITSINRQ